MASTVAPTRASNLCKLVCTNCLTTATDGTSIWRKFRATLQVAQATELIFLFLP